MKILRLVVLPLFGANTQPKCPTPSRPRERCDLLHVTLVQWRLLYFLNCPQSEDRAILKLGYWSLRGGGGGGGGESLIKYLQR